MILATASDLELFVIEKSPHVKTVEIDSDNDNNIVQIKIRLQWWYRFFYEETFYKFITEQLEQNKMYGMTIDVILIS